MRFALAISAIAGCSLLSACATSNFQKSLDSQDWFAASEEFLKDTSLKNDESALYRAARLHGSPDRETFNPRLARSLYERLIWRFPASSKVQISRDQIALLDELERTRKQSEEKVRAAEFETQRLLVATQSLIFELDSLSKIQSRHKSRTDSLSAVIARLEADLRTKDDQLRSLQAELAKLKQIDLGSPANKR